ncbi:hypothetical protein CBL_02955 [Carabus blaptoides fortunei]
MLVFPWHRYLGPGNEINYLEPVDSDDRIALLHDISYANANSLRDVRNSDVVAIFQFIEDFEHTCNWHAITGYLGLLAKYIGESVFGSLYPGVTLMPPAKYKNRGQYLYGRKQTQFGELWRAYKSIANHNIPFSQFRSLFGTKEKYEALCERVHQSNIGRLPAWTDAPPYEASNEETLEDLLNVLRGLSNENIAGPSGVRRSTITEVESQISSSNSLSPPDKRAKHSDTLQTYESPESAGDSPVDSVLNLGFMEPEIPEMMDLTQDDNVNSGTTAYAITRIADVQNGKEFLTTPLAYVPVDNFGWYMNETELHSLNGFCKIMEVKSKCIVLGTRTSFVTGESITAQATHEHIPIVVSSVGLNRRCYYEIHGYNVDAAKHMIPTTLADFDLDGEIKKYYGPPNDSTNIGCAQLSQRRMAGYCVLVNNRQTTGAVGSLHDEGWFQLDTRTDHDHGYKPIDPRPTTFPPSRQPTTTT